MRLAEVLPLLYKAPVVPLLLLAACAGTIGGTIAGGGWLVEVFIPGNEVPAFCFNIVQSKMKSYW
jgi:hypothetical protein